MLQPDEHIYIQFFGCVPLRSTLKAHCLFLSHSFLSLLFLLQRSANPAGERGNRCPDMRFSLMRIRNIFIKTHNPPLNPSLQNHLHSPVLLHTAAVAAHFGPIVLPRLISHPGLRLPLSPLGVSYIWSALIRLSDEMSRKGQRKIVLLCALSVLSPVWSGKWGICLMRTGMDGDRAGRQRDRERRCAEDVQRPIPAKKGHTFQATSASVIMTSEPEKVTLMWDRWIRV